MIETIGGRHKVNTNKPIKSVFLKEDFFFQL